MDLRNLQIPKTSYYDSYVESPGGDAGDQSPYSDVPEDAASRVDKPFDLDSFMNGTLPGQGDSSVAEPFDLDTFDFGLYEPPPAEVASLPTIISPSTSRLPQFLVQPTYDSLYGGFPPSSVHKQPNREIRNHPGSIPQYREHPIQSDDLQPTDANDGLAKFLKSAEMQSMFSELENEAKTSAEQTQNIWTDQHYVPTKPSHFQAPRRQNFYYNSILGEFAEPYTPLRIIDQIYNPFPPSVIKALLIALKSHPKLNIGHSDQSLEEFSKEQRDRKRRRPTTHSDGDDLFVPEDLVFSPTSKYKPKPPPRRVSQKDAARLLRAPQYMTHSEISGASTPTRKQPKSRTQKILKWEPWDHYERLPEKPQAWMGYNPRSGHSSLFEFTKDGELSPGKLLSDDEICAYLHGPAVAPSPMPRYLTIWLQNTPADAASKYPTSKSSKCRYDGCPDKNNTIRNGDYRLAFDEQSSYLHPKMNPFYNSFYLHLYCMEKMLNFPQFARMFKVKLDTREFLLNGDKNPMAITRDYKQMAKICKDFILNASGGSHEDDAPKHEWFQESLTRKLTLYHLNRQPEHVKKQREERGGINIEIHEGNLDLKAEGVLARYRKRAAIRKGETLPSPKKITAPRTKKRLKKQETESDSDSELEKLYDRDRPIYNIRPSPRGRKSAQTDINTVRSRGSINGRFDTENGLDHISGDQDRIQGTRHQPSKSHDQVPKIGSDGNLNESDVELPIDQINQVETSFLFDSASGSEYAETPSNKKRSKGRGRTS